MSCRLSLDLSNARAICMIVNTTQNHQNTQVMRENTRRVSINRSQCLNPDRYNTPDEDRIIIGLALTKRTHNVA